MEIKTVAPEKEKKSLLALHSEYAWVERSLEDTEGEITPEIEKALEEKLMAICQKADAYGVVIDRLEMKAAFFKEESDRLRGFAKVIEGIIARLKAMMKFVLAQMPGQEVQGEYYRFSLAKTKPSLKIDEANLPKQYMKAEIKYSPDRDAIEADLAKGISVPGVLIVENTSLRKGRPRE